jgi:hypothetical protein
MDSWKEILNNMNDSGKGNPHLENKIEQVKSKLYKSNHN